MDIIALVVGVAIGGLIAYLVAVNLGSSKLHAVEAEREQLKGEVERVMSDMARRLSEKEEMCNRLVDAEKEHSAQIKLSAKEDIEKERQHFISLRAEDERQWNEKLNAMKQEMHKMAAEQLSAKQADLQNTNRMQFDELMKPIKEQFASFQKAVEESKTQNEVSKKHLEDTFEKQMSLFAQQQNMAISSIKEQTERIGNDASNLTKALKGDSKVQGDWGEMILETILEQTGLVRDKAFFVQPVYHDDENRVLRPDVVVCFPDQRSVVIDSKVSLTAFNNAVNTIDEVQREAFLKEHVKSVRKHIDELSEKNYAKYVDNSMKYVLMFVPNESSYIAAMQADADLHRYAYNKNIIIISSSNLLMTLQLAYNIWQADLRDKNVEELVKKATLLYERMVDFQTDMKKVDDALQRVNTAFGEAQKKLSIGRGNILVTAEKMIGMGLTPKKRLNVDADDQE